MSKPQTLPVARTRPGDWVQLTEAKSHRFFLIQLTPGETLHTHHGVIEHDRLIGLPWGSQVTTHLGTPFFVLPPSLSDILRETRRRTQIIFPKDIGYILLKLNIGPGTHVIEAGTGSGALTTAFAYAVGDTGRVYSYERRADMQALARQNLAQWGLDARVIFHLRDIKDGFLEHDVPALFLDVPTPEAYIPQVRDALRPGGFFGALVPTTNQVSRLLQALEEHGFGFVEVAEILLRYYKPVAERLRPTDRMVAHTGYLIFARPLYREDEPAAQPDASQTQSPSEGAPTA
ncbi:MAG: tRNA (adenine-N1)-methyltransferase [Chloroflexi bacterium]|nr:tRNA (adenine-N1)-methyltransferase [Chloroflexota bacterium]